MGKLHLKGNALWSLHKMSQSLPKDSVSLVTNNSSMGSQPSRYRIRGFHELLPDYYPNIKRFNYISSWGEAASRLGESSAQSITQQTSQEAPITRSKRPSAGCLSGTPESNHATSNSSCNQSTGDKTPSAGQPQSWCQTMAMFTPRLLLIIQEIVLRD